MGEEGIPVQDRPMHANPPPSPKSRLASSEEPAPEFAPALFALHLLVVLQIIADDQAGTAASPLGSTNLLFRPPGEDAELIAICALHHDVGGGFLQETLDLKVAGEVLVLAQLGCDVAQLLVGFLLRVADDD